MTLDQSEEVEASKAKPVQAPQRHELGKTVVGMSLIVLAAIAMLVYSGINSRTASAASLARETKENATLAVSVTHPKMSGAEEEIVLPGNIQAFTDSPIYARTNGY